MAVGKDLGQQGLITVAETEDATEEVSEELDGTPIIDEKFGSNDPIYYDQLSESFENHGTEADQTLSNPRQSILSNQGLLFQPPEKLNDGKSKSDRSKRSSLSGNSTNKNEKRSLTENKLGIECENNECNDKELETKITDSRRQKLDDEKLMIDDLRSSEDISPHHSQENRTQMTHTTRHDTEQTRTEPTKIVKSRKDKLKRKPKAEVEEEEVPEESPKLDQSLLAAHFGGQTNRYVHTRHAQYLGNGHLYHPGGVFKDWEPSPWVRHLSMDKHFHLRDNGTLMVSKPGLYFVYAQIYYSNAHSLSSYRMYRNDEPLLQCTIEMHNKPEKTRNTCFAAGLVYLDAHDQLSLKEVEGERITIFEKTKSFFGLFKVNQN